MMHVSSDPDSFSMLIKQRREGRFRLYLKLLGEALQVVRVELHDMFHKLLYWDGIHVICGRKHISISIYTLALY